MFATDKAFKIASGLHESHDTVNDKVYDQMEQYWLPLYKGYCPEIHKTKRKSIANPSGVDAKMLTMNFPKLACAYKARLVFSENVDFSIYSNSGRDTEALAVDEFIRDIFKRNRFFKTARVHAEKDMYALGGFVVKPFFSNGKISYDFVSATDFIPTEWVNGMIRGGSFISRSHKNGYSYTKVENQRIEGNTCIVENRLYKSKKSDKLGERVDLSELYDDLEEMIQIENVSKPLFAYFKSANANNVELESPLGISAFANSIDTLQALDTWFDSLHREIKLGKLRTVLSHTALREITPTKEGMRHGLYFDTEDEAFEIINTGESDTGSPNSPLGHISPLLRVQEHVMAINTLLDVLSSQLGISGGTFSFDGKSMKTATEVVSEDSETYLTKRDDENDINFSMMDLFEATVIMGQLYGLIKDVDLDDFHFQTLFDDSIIVDDNKRREEALLEVDKGLRSVESFMKEFRGLDEKEIQEELDKIKNTQQRGYQDFMGGVEEEIEEDTNEDELEV